MDDREQREIEDRRKFLISAGRFAAVTPPAITLLLSTSLTSDAIAHSGAKGSRGNNGYGNGGGDGSPTARMITIADSMSVPVEITSERKRAKPGDRAGSRR